MPRTKLDTRNKDRKKLEELIRSNVFSHKTNISETASSIGFRSNKTMYNRLKTPENFSLKELKMTRRTLDISQDELIEAIKPWL